MRSKYLWTLPSGSTTEAKVGDDATGAVSVGGGWMPVDPVGLEVVPCAVAGSSGEPLPQAANSVRRAIEKAAMMNKRFIWVSK
jgi:hypothetical protein